MSHWEKELTLDLCNPTSNELPVFNCRAITYRETDVVPLIRYAVVLEFKDGNGTDLISNPVFAEFIKRSFGLSKQHITSPKILGEDFGDPIGIPSNQTTQSKGVLIFSGLTGSGHLKENV